MATVPPVPPLGDDGPTPPPPRTPRRPTTTTEPPPAPTVPEPARAPAPETPAPAGRELAPRATDTSAYGVFAGHATTEPDGTASETGPVLTIQGLLGMRAKKVKPFEDYVSDSTRTLRIIQVVVDLIVDNSPGVTKQEVVRDAMLGITPLPPALLAEAFKAEYGYDMPELRPGMFDR